MIAAPAPPSRHVGLVMLSTMFSRTPHLVNPSMTRRFAPLAALLFLVVSSTACTSQRMSQVVSENIAVLRAFDTAEAIPAETMRSAKAVAVLRESGGAVVVGASGGEGVLVRRLEKGWSPPLAIEMSTGSIGLQIGGQTREIVLLFTTDASVDRLLATGVVAIGRIEGVAGTAQGRTSPDSPEPDVIPFVRSDGLFGGLSINGLGFGPSQRVNNSAYGATWTVRQVLSGELPPPPGSWSLWTMLDQLDR